MKAYLAANHWTWTLWVLWLPCNACLARTEPGLLGHWKLAGDCRDYSGRENHGVNHGADLADPQGATFDGVDDYIEVPAAESLALGRKDFSFAVWIHTAVELDDVLGDILSKYDPATSTNCHEGKGLYRYEGEGVFKECGRLGNERQVMPMAVYNGKLYAGTLPLAQVCRYDGQDTWSLTGRLDHTPEVKFRRVWAMAVFDGRLFAGTLPSGHVYSLEAGKCVTHDRALVPGWRHLAAVKAGDRLKLYVDGKCVDTSEAFDPVKYDLSNRKSLLIGFGEHDYFNGRLRDLRIYERALSEAEIGSLSKSP